MYDLLIKGGICYDGTGREGFKADVAIKDGLIAKVGEIDAEAAKVIDAKDLAVAPGFIDTHSHSDLVALVEPDIANKTTQGITTDVIGQDGMSLAPVLPRYVSTWQKTMAGLEGQYPVEWRWESAAEYMKALDAMDLGPNLAYLAPTGNIRMCVIGLSNRKATPSEVSMMKDLLEKCIEAGAVGLSTGLIYPPSSYMEEDEIAQVTSVLAKYDLPFVIHQRSEADTILESMDEVFHISRKSGCPIHFSHFKVCGKKNAHLFDAVMKKLDEGERDIKLSFDQYPYGAGSTTFSVILPPWAHDGGADQCLLRLADEAERQRMKQDIVNGLPGWDNFIDFAGMENILVTFVKTPQNADLVGKNMVEIGEIRGRDPLDAAFDLLLQEELAVGLVDFYGLEEHVRTIMTHHLQNPCTDGILGAQPHPRVYGTFSRILGHYVRELGLMTLPEAIRKMTSRPASIFHLEGRGVLKEGYVADVTVFDPEKVIDKATYTAPMQFSEGIPFVIVGGKTVVENSQVLKGKAGKVLRFKK